MKPTIYEIYGTRKKTGEQIKTRKLVIGDTTLNTLIKAWNNEGINVHYAHPVGVLDMPPHYLIDYIDEVFTTEPPF